MKTAHALIWMSACAEARALQRESVTVRAMCLTSVECVEATAFPKEIASEGNQFDALGVCGGDCAVDEDADGICDDVDPCVGELDECGICNGPGEIYACGCSDIPEGDCDCDGNQLDALDVCGGDCAADVDADGICDDVDDRVGAYDECGICNGPGAAYEWDVRTSLRVIATVTAVSLTRLASVVATARQTPMLTASVTTATTALANSTSAASATAPTPSTIADALTSLKGTATVTATNSTPSGSWW